MDYELSVPTRPPLFRPLAMHSVLSGESEPLTAAVDRLNAEPTVFAEPVEVMRERVRDVVEATGREVTFIAAKVQTSAQDVEVLYCKVQLEGGGDFEIRRKANCDPSTPWVDPAALEWM